MAGQIDYDRGVLKRTVDGLGLDVYMYVDSPGVYLNAHGNEVSSEIAIKAGFPVNQHMKQRRLRDALAAAHDKIRKEMALADGEKVVVIERRGFKMLDIGLDRFQILDPDGDILTKEPLSKAEADIVFDQLVPENENEPNGASGGSGDRKSASRD